VLYYEDLVWDEFLCTTNSLPIQVEATSIKTKMSSRYGDSSRHFECELEQVTSADDLPA
jgi:hypothetical protein